MSVLLSIRCICVEIASSDVFVLVAHTSNTYLLGGGVVTER